MKKILLLFSFVILFATKVSAQTTITAQTGFYTNDSLYSLTEEWYKINGNLMSYGSCCNLSDGLKIAVFDSATCEPWISIGTGVGNEFGVYGEFHCQIYSTPAFDFYFSSNQDRITVRKFLDTIPHGNYVLAMTHLSPHYSLWDSDLINAFQSIGSTLTSSNLPSDSIPYIIIGQRGAVPGSVPELILPDGSLHQLSREILCANAIADINGNEIDFSIFPNPSADNINIDIPDNAIIEILNMQGQIIKTIANTEKETTIDHVGWTSRVVDLTNVSSGIYIIKVQNEKGIGVKKFVKE